MELLVQVPVLDMSFPLFCLFRMESRSACEWIISTFNGEEYPGEYRMGGEGQRGNKGA